MKIIKNKKAVVPIIPIVIAIGIGLILLPWIILGFVGMVKLLTFSIGPLPMWAVAIILIFSLLLIKKQR